VLAYLAGAWLVLQVATVVGQHFAWPAWGLRGLTALLAVGLLAAVIVAWYHGEKGAQRVTAVEVLLLAGVLAMAAAAVALARPDPASVPEPSASGSGEAISDAPGHGSVAVLPFVNTSPDPDNEYFSDGMTEELLHALAGVAELQVASRTSSFAFKGRDLPVQEIGRALNVASVVEGSVRRAGARVRITARLTDVAGGYQLWSDSYTRDLRDIFEVQDEIARDVARVLRVRLVGEDSSLVRRPTDDLDAYDAYLRGRFLWHRRTRESLLDARDEFQRAVDRSPDFALAHLGLADALAVLGFYDHLPPRDAFPAARDAARRALAIEPGLAQAHATLGYVALYYDWDWDGAEREFRTAIRLSPDYSTAHQWLANHLVATGRFDEAADAMRRALEIEPLSLIASAALGWVHLLAGDHDAALAQLRSTLDLDPTFHLARVWEGLSLLDAGRHDQAIATLERARDDAPTDPTLAANLAMALALAGRELDARGILDDLEPAAGTGYLPAYEIARAHLALGDPDSAVQWLQRARDDRSHSIAFLAVDPFLSPLRGHGGFQRLLRETGH
jgi:TolB-like protein/Tfp pilus assembly protein PilF